MKLQPVAVEIRVTVEGAITPLRMEWRGRWLTIAQISRTWSDEAGDHWLIMPALPQRVFDLCRTSDGLWQAGSLDRRAAVT